MAGLFGPGRQPSSGQTTGREAPCGCYTCQWQLVPTLYVYFPDAPKNCYGIVGFSACRVEMAKMPDKGKAYCQKIKKELGITSFRGRDCPEWAAECGEEDKKPPKKPCENPPPENTPPWFDTGSCEGESESVASWGGAQIVDDQNRLLPPGQVWCVANYSICRSSFRDAPQIISVIKKVTIDVAAWKGSHYKEAVTAACQSFMDEHKSAPDRKICCDTWEEASKGPLRPGACDPISDPDCDGIPNYQDPFPLHPRSTEYTSNSPLTNFPFWKDFKNAIPHESCECQWELIDARYKCSDVRVQNSARRGSSNQAKYNYQAKWKCPATGREIITTREVTMPGLSCPRGRPNS
jgi:hypothetical protein